MKFFTKTSLEMPIDTEEYHEMECISNKISKQRFMSAISPSGLRDVINSEINKNKSFGEPFFSSSRFIGMPCLVLSLHNEDIFLISNVEDIDLKKRRDVIKEISKKIENEIFFIVSYEISSKKMSGYNEGKVTKSIENTVRSVVEDKGIRDELFNYKIPLDYIYLNSDTPILSASLKKISEEILPNIPFFEKNRRMELQTQKSIRLNNPEP